MHGWTKGHQTHPVLHKSPGQNLVLAWGSENNCKPEVGMANVEKQKLLLSAKIVEKRSVGSPKKKRHIQHKWVRICGKPERLLLKTAILMGQTRQEPKVTSSA